MSDEHEEIRKYVRDNDEKISELEKKFESNLGIEGVYNTRFTMLMDKLNELKEQIKVIRRFSNKVCDEAANNTEVLRDYFEYRKIWSEKIMKKNAIFGYNDALNTWMMISLHKFSTKVLEKLDSGGDKESGRARLARETAETAEKQRLKIENDSGGEKPPEHDIRSVYYKGNLYWMPKGEVNELISKFVEKLEHCYKHFTKLTLSNLIEEYEEKLK